MAVVQISRIQIRRGQENTGTGLPQLASGELAWAIDTQQLYIGNGSVAEGAPAVGNTKILTQNDLSAQGNLLALLQYVYKTNDTTVSTGPTVNSPISRSLQLRLDDFITTREFGVVGDGVTDDTDALQRAIDQLFLNSAGKASADSASGASRRIVLEIPGGVYVTSRPLYIPSYATIKGAGEEKTIIQYNSVRTITGSTTNNSFTLNTTAAHTILIGATVTGANIPNNTYVESVVSGVSVTLSQRATGTATGTFTFTLNKPAIQFINDTSTIGNPSTIGNTQGITQPRRISLSGITVESLSGSNICLQLDAVRDSVFENITLKGNWTVPVTQSNNCMAMLFQSVSSLVTCEDNLFSNIKMYGFTTAVYAKQDILNNIFENCLVNDAEKGFLLGKDADGVSIGQEFGPRQTQIVNCKFINVKQHGVFVDLGTGNTVKDCRFTNVGSDGAGILGTVYPIIYFYNFGNTSENNYTDRTDALSTEQYLQVKYVPEVAGHGVHYSYGTLTSSEPITQQLEQFLFRLPCPTNEFGSPSGTINYEIDYFYTSSTNQFSRRGKITLVANIEQKRIQLSDEFDYAGNNGTTNSLLLDFSAAFLDELGGLWTTGETPGSIAIKYSNTLSGDIGTFVYSYKAVF